MKARTLLYVILGGIGLYALRGRGRSREPEGLEGEPDVPPSRPKPPHKPDAQQPAFCEQPEFFEDKTEAFRDAFERAWDALGYTGGGFDNMSDAREKAHNLALYVMEDVCPALPLPDARHQVDGYAKKYGNAWVGAYDTPFGWAWSRLVQMPV